MESQIAVPRSPTEMVGQLQVTQSLNSILNLSKTVKLDDTLLMRQYMMQKGVPFLDCVGEQLDKMKKPFD